MESTSSRAIIVHPRWTHTLDVPPITVQPPTWTHLPREVLLQIASTLEASDLCNLAATSRELRCVGGNIVLPPTAVLIPPCSCFQKLLCCRQLAADEAVWEALCRQKFSVPQRRQPPSSWRELFKFNYQVMVQLFSGRQKQEAPSWPGMQQMSRGPILISAGTGIQ